MLLTNMTFFSKLKKQTLKTFIFEAFRENEFSFDVKFAFVKKFF